MTPGGVPPRGAVSGTGDGTRREDRLPDALAPGWFRPDELDDGALLRIAARVAGALRWRDAVEEAGTEASGGESWADLYLEDESWVLTEMAGTDPERLRASFRALEDRGRVAEQAERVRRLAADLDRWIRVLRRSEHPRSVELAATLSEMVGRELHASLAEAERMAGEGSALEGAPGPSPGAFLPVWRTAPAAGIGRDGPSLPEGPSDDGREGSGLADAARRLVNAVAYLGDPARSCLEEVLTGGRVPPAMALVRTFVQLLLRTRDGLDAFPRRRLDFYYGDVLGVRGRGRTPDRAHLVVTAAPGVPSLLVPGGTAFSAPGAGETGDLVYAADEDTRLSDARVVALRSLCFERDRLISPERELGYVTSVLGGAAPAPDVRAAEGARGPAFSGAGAGNPWTSQGIHVGFAVASPVLELAEGTRSVSFEVELGVPVDGPPRSLEEDVADLEEVPAGDREGFVRRLGRIAARALLGPRDGPRLLPAAETEAVLAAARRILDGRDRDHASSREGVEELFTRDADVLFHDLFRTAFHVRFTGEEGWEEAPRVYVAPRRDGRTGLRIEMELGPEVGAVRRRDPELHGPGSGEGQPVVAFRVNPQSVFCPFSLLDALAVVAVEVGVEVDGVRDLVVHNALGPLDPSRPFQPFGPLPSLDSFLVVGSLEAARKRMTWAELEMEWGDLPHAPGGFRQHYRLYGGDVTNDAFRVRIAVLRDGRWVPTDPEKRPVARLFETGDEGGGIAREVRIPLAVADVATPLAPSATQEEFRTLSRARQGLFRLSLSPSRTTFGHQAYPRLLGETLSRNARRRRSPEPLPEPPYTPLVTRISLRYQARDRLRPGAAEEDARTGAGLFHRHAFGWEPMGGGDGTEPSTLMPPRPFLPAPDGVRRHRDGYLLLGLAGDEMAGPLPLLFHLLPDAARRGGARGHADPAWFHLVGNRWRPLEATRVLGDGTEGFQRSGIVTLDLPRTSGPPPTVLPQGLRWIAVGVARPALTMLSRLLSVTAGAVAVTWRDHGRAAPHLERGLPPGSITRAEAPVPGLGSVVQVGATFGGRPAEDREETLARTSERLRHRARAVSPWDWERLVLARFPRVWKVKVFPATRVDVPGPAPGRVLVVVVPRPSPGEEDEAPAPRLASAELARIEAWLGERASGFATVRVRNPVYERVQVRCTVKLSPGSRPGQRLRELDRALVELISPWHPGGYGARFGWRIRRDEVEAHLREIPWVEWVTGFSMLQVTRDEEGRYLLGDTARAGEGGSADARPSPPAREATRELVARYPWSLAVPFRRHFVETTSADREQAAEVTGVGELEIGSNLILDAGRPHG